MNTIRLLKKIIVKSNVIKLLIIKTISNVISIFLIKIFYIKSPLYY